ncbi:unnamed protein product, partial [Pipistrellus nathusii]
MDPCSLQIFQKELICSICRNCFIDPITTDCGHSFCRPCFHLSWPNRSVIPRCSVCQKRIQQKDFHTNAFLKKKVLIARQAYLGHFLRSKENGCRIHMEAKQIFCENQRSLLCLHCSTSKEHEAHRHCSVEEAIEEHREKLLKTMCSLWEKCCENDRNLNVETVTTRSWEVYVNSKSEAIRTEYGNLSLLLGPEKDNHLERLKREGKEIFEQLKASEASMAHKRELLRGMYTELKEMCHKPDVELLLDFGDILHRSEQVQLHMPQPLQPELTARPITGLMDRLNPFRVQVSFTGEITPENIRLFDDVRSLRFMGDALHVSLDPGTSNSFAAWGNRVFKSGKHYWEVYVDKSWDWAVGVCKEPWMETNGTLTECKDTFLLIHVKEDNHTTLWTTAPMARQYIQKPLSRVGVFLDVDNRTVSFVDVARCSLIKHSFIRHSPFQDYV